MARSSTLLLSGWLVPLARSTGPSACGQLSGAARSEAEVRDHQECEHESIRFEALQAASALSRSRPYAEREAGEADPAKTSASSGQKSVEGNPYAPGPNVYLADLVDHDNPWGYCLDIAGSPPHPQCDKIQGHTCKEEGRDTQFRYDPDTQSIVSQNFNQDCSPMYDGYQDGRAWQADLTYTSGGCLRAAGSLEVGVSLVLVACHRHDLLQKFAYTRDRRFAVGNTSLCLVLGREREERDGFSSRRAELQDCAAWPAELSTWEVWRRAAGAGARRRAGRKGFRLSDGDGWAFSELPPPPHPSLSPRPRLLVAKRS
ncbi:unnamed protein product [Prorocentrum cordatum]|uniref:Ricin B lectin domain-containing protein n=1 Tax=Prorocentrum cordatum TaxID=2364126 RepID=A0ABN9VTP6_9DINO|nr:unnamed protein product [Polarella glacialis]